VPAMVSGKVEGALAAGARLAIALNGRVTAVVPAYRDRGELRFGALVPPREFRAGPNRVAVYAVTGRGPSAALAPLSVAPQGAAPRGRLAEDATRIDLGRRELRVREAGDWGFVENMKGPDRLHLAVSGWAARRGQRRPVDRVLVFADGRLIAAGKPDRPRPDVAGDLGSGALMSGYGFAIARRDAAELAGSPSRIRVFAAVGDVATELARADGAGGP
jgi:hypothetical protein